ncbi:DUF1484 domain-containing protein [Ralstonia syzygii subsp. celebesensis]|uniref:DUF1484 domain-containing protein n=4 Tax=Ralstonia solanacearum species complex TaxID=3116862 RepID=A0AAD0S615_RALSL|nr:MULTISPECIES: DUF1484 domain-containing protein [Ralstonia solanacearum species complex]CCA80137.1 conserved hypothetical protein [blood disease bacterium R229]AQW29726.1 hypothetical protein B0B51_06800 [blood disease bacterium A2-HR MARDI]AXV80319.1 DUF1484 domain-containing protein [Ralstonia solanacearum]AXW51464.1 DUF1484 domain-containing protein [Ralstonia solanacearum]QQV56967.1 DUF1484 domain-containing protein [Ralstonia syzygii subsp. celebesensis]
MREPSGSPQLLAFVRQRQLIAQLATQAGKTGKRVKAPAAQAVQQLDIVSGLICETAEEACAQLLSVSAGLAGILQLLDLRSERSAECHSLHCLLAPLKAQLDRSLNDVQKML